ncbi:MAG: lamin tail domain-containing protein [Gammaproteobacteria bacterium]|nr:lamin tail domain-containing protein [Gammaproteobacteria bacterium]
MLSACGGSGGGDGSPTNSGNGGDTNSSNSGGGNNPEDDGNAANETSRDIGLYINEVMPEIRLNKSTALQDTDNSPQPWLEIYNSGSSTIDLTGFSLVASGDGKQSWSFPSVQIQAKDFLRIWGSGKDRSNNPGELHTSFSIMGMQSLTLKHKDGSVLDKVKDIVIPPDQSWGRYPDGQAWTWFYDSPTPGAPNPQGNDRFSLNCDDLSLTAGAPFQLKTTPSTNVTWQSDNGLVNVDSKGELFAASEGKGKQNLARITASDADGNSRSCEVTVVNWMANRSRLTVVGTPAADFLIDYMDGQILHSTPGKLFASTDGMKSSEQIGSFPTTPTAPIMRKTPYGYFASTGPTIYYSPDLSSWAPDLAMRHENLNHGFAHFHDDHSGKSYLYAGEYSTGNTDIHSVYKGVQTQHGPATWKEVLRFGSLQDFYNDHSKLDTIRHIHLVITDPYTGHVWVGTGDADQHSRLYYSDDNGSSFKLIGVGSQKFRSLSVWFTKDYVYWNMDSELVPEHVYRLPRSKYHKNGNEWASLTPELSSGTTKPGVKYMITATKGYHFPHGVGYIYIEDQARQLSYKERVRPIEDPQYDYSEDVAELTHASHWYHLWVKDQNGEDVLIMNTSAEGTEPFQRDEKSRTFGFKERSDGSVDVQELLAMPSKTPDVHNAYTQLIPNLQDQDGYIYFRGRETAHRTYKMRLHWVDQ